MIDKLYHYMYNNEYNDADSDVTAPVLLNVRMVAAAEKYFVDHLAHLAISKLDYYLAGAWCSEAFTDAVEEAWTTTADADRQLRDTLLKVVIEHVDELFDKEQPKYPHFHLMVSKTPSFSMEVAGLLAKAEGERRRMAIYFCPGSCGAMFFSNMKEGQVASRKCGKCARNDVATDFAGWQAYRKTVDARLVVGVDK